MPGAEVKNDRKDLLEFEITVIFIQFVGKNPGSLFTETLGFRRSDCQFTVNDFTDFTWGRVHTFSKRFLLQICNIKKRLK